MGDGSEVDRLRLNLRSANEWIAKKGKREAAIRALISVADHLSRLGCDAEERQLIYVVIDALSEAEKGIEHPLTGVSRQRRGFPGKTWRQTMLEVHSSVVVSLLMDAGDSLDEAARKVSVAIDGRLDPNQIKTARKNISAHRTAKTGEFARHIYAEQLKDIRTSNVTSGNAVTAEAKAARGLKALRAVMRREVF